MFSLPISVRLGAAFAIVAAGGLGACKPPATDDYIPRGANAPKPEAPSAPQDSPDTANAIWAQSQQDNRLLYGLPGKVPLMAIECNRASGARTILFTRFAPADPKAQALMAIIGNGHVARIPVDAKWNGKVWLWESSIIANSPQLSVFTGKDEIDLTIPGAGTLAIHPTAIPGAFIASCDQGLPWPPPITPPPITPPSLPGEEEGNKPEQGQPAI